MRCQILFPGKKKKNIDLSSAELAQRVVKVKYMKAYMKQYDQGLHYLPLS